MKAAGGRTRTVQSPKIPRPAARRALLVFAAVRMYFVGIDAGVMTAGVVSAAKAAHRGATMTVHSLVGFATGFISPTVFGAVLDLAGGRG
ncbi:MAG: hypothetical protein HY526_00065 [Betaproteobacteria bacterium]|nr:hypothetical protein [Betaproteobacteria bacterium]